MCNIFTSFVRFDLKFYYYFFLILRVFLFSRETFVMRISTFTFTAILSWVTFQMRARSRTKKRGFFIRMLIKHRMHSKRHCNHSGLRQVIAAYTGSNKASFDCIPYVYLLDILQLFLKFKNIIFAIRHVT